MRHEKTVSVSKIRLLWEPWKEDETPRNIIFVRTIPSKTSFKKMISNGLRNKY
jgi:hypothetical protein